MDRRIVFRLGAIAGTAALLAVPASAGADQRVISGPAPNTFVNPDVTTARGEALNFLNADPAGAGPHNITSVKAKRVRRHGRRVRVPLFRSATVGAGQEVGVTGVTKLPAGNYEFLCTLHPWMKGT